MLLLDPPVVADRRPIAVVRRLTDLRTPHAESFWPSPSSRSRCCHGPGSPRAGLSPQPFQKPAARLRRARVRRRWRRSSTATRPWTIVRFMDQVLADRRQSRVQRLRRSHQVAAARRQGVASRVDEFAGRGRGWDYQVGTVVVRGQRRGACCRAIATACRSASIRSPRRLAAIDAPLVDVGNGAAAADYEGKVVKGAVVLGSADAGRLWQQAVKARGAVGFISTSIAPYIRPDDPATFTSTDQQDVFQWGAFRTTPARKAFGFKASWRAAERMRDAAQGRARSREGRRAVHLLRRSESLAHRRDSWPVEAAGTHRDGRPRAGAWRQRRWQRLRDAVRARRGAASCDRDAARCRRPSERSRSCGPTRSPAAVTG